MYFRSLKSSFLYIGGCLEEDIDSGLAAEERAPVNWIPACERDLECVKHKRLISRWPKIFFKVALQFGTV